MKISGAPYMDVVNAARPDWEEILDRLPDVILGLDESGRISFLKGNGMRFVNFDESTVLGLTLRELLIRFRKCRIQECGPNGIRSISIEDDRIEGGALELETMEHLRLQSGHEVWILRNITEQCVLDRFLDSYHDNVEQEFTRIISGMKNSLEKLTIALVTALENANLFNDNETGSHILRVSGYSALLAEKLGFDEDFVKRLKLYSPLHDVGKVGIPDSLLKKPGVYTPEEHLQMQQHVVIGARMLDHPEIDTMARNIALYHHEKWDGSGYIGGLKGMEIPVEARIVALADMYDALHSRRIYKDAYTHKKAVTMITEVRGTSFEPMIVDVFLENEGEFDAINKRFA